MTPKKYKTISNSRTASRIYVRVGKTEGRKGGARLGVKEQDYKKEWGRWNE